jgi:8-oxo-dGTP pyrophosphatase MutT (NUDIX family)
VRYNGLVTQVPDDLPLIERVAVRLVVLDLSGQLLLLHTHDPTYPELGTWWELPGGGLEDGETTVEAAIRELREETGIMVTPLQLRTPTWRRKASFRYRGTRYLQREEVLVAQLPEAEPAVDGFLRVGFEEEDYFGYRWWSIAEVLASRESFYPGRLPQFLQAVLAGQPIEEPFELWS